MRAISGLGTAQEPLFDKSRIAAHPDYGTRRNSILPENLDETFPKSTWTRAHHDKERRFPQTISHRGYKALNPENTLRSFKAAVEAGTHALETDIHLSKDDVVVLSHDQDLKRCFGKENKIIDCDWEFLSQQRTTMAPHEPMPRLSDLLEYLAQPEQQHLWLLLDIKVDNDANNVMKLIAETINSVDPGSTKWKGRVVLGIWAIRYLPLCAQFLPGFSISFIGWSTFYARQFLKVPNVSFNMFQKILHGPIGSRFIRDVKKADRPLYVWTVNDVNLMKWSIQKEVDGVITDDPKLFREVCDNWNDNEPAAKLTWHQFSYIVWIYMMIVVFWVPFRRRFPESINTFLRTTKDGTANAAQKTKK